MSTHLGLPENREPQMLMACWWLSSFSPLEFAQIISQTHLNNIKVSCKHHPIFKAYESPATSTYHLICPKIIGVFGFCPNPSGRANAAGRTSWILRPQRSWSSASRRRMLRPRLQRPSPRRRRRRWMRRCRPRRRQPNVSAETRLRCDVDQKRIRATGGMSSCGGRVFNCPSSCCFSMVLWGWLLGASCWISTMGFLGIESNPISSYIHPS